MRKFLMVSILLLIVFIIAKDAISLIWYLQGKEFSFSALKKEFAQEAQENTTVENTIIDSVYTAKDTIIGDAVASKPKDTIVLLGGEKSIVYEKKINDWRLVLVNYDNTIEKDFEVELANIDNSRQFDARAIDDLNQMLKDMKKNGYKNIWPQSAYRSIARQEELFNERVEKNIRFGLSQEEAENAAKKYINKPGTSEHNLGLAIDFNNIKESFENTKEFKWLQENAENYGFILRYRADKVDITKVNYEPWHWRYVGVKHAKKMNELDMCLEEYIKYLLDNM